MVIAEAVGGVEDLLAFSDEALCRAVAGARTPVVSAIGHEPDTPLLDHVADLRCSTPTAAGRTIVPDAAGQRGSRGARTGPGGPCGWVNRERGVLDLLRGRPVLAAPYQDLVRRAENVTALVLGARNSMRRTLTERTNDLSHLQSRLTSLGPAATLARGYAVVQHVTNSEDATAPSARWPVLRSVTDAAAGARLRIRLADGTIPAVIQQHGTA